MRFSIIIPVAPERNPEVIESLKNLDYPKNNFHVIVVKGKNPSDNRNKGVEKSRGEIIVFLDDDAKVGDKLLKKADEFFSTYPFIDIVGGPQITPLNDTKFGRISGYALSSVFGAWKVANRYSGKKTVLDADETMLTSANLFCKKQVFKKIRFDTKLYPGEDPDFISRAKQAGFKVAYCPQMIVYHKRRTDLKKLSKQIYNYGKTRPKKENLRETLKMPFFLVPSLFFIYLIFLIILSLSNAILTGSIIGEGRIGTLSAVLLLPLLLYIILNFLFSLANSLENKDFEAIFQLPLIYLMIHLSYGLGFLTSTIENILGRRKKNLNALYLQF